MSTPLPLDHVGIAVRSLAEAVPLFERLTGSRGSPPERVESQGVELVFVGEGPARLELLAPLSEASPVARFLAARGPGLHHLAYRVPDIRAALRELVADGFRAVDAEPRAGAHGHLVAFLHPRSTGGVLMELVQG
ncbi:MAG TPA: methylmalonyl-CoA epimerase [Longimicrobiales bacterium]|nr:methylmalonyl-CoA epimerase [Longimicrobiales bacterium]